MKIRTKIIIACLMSIVVPLVFMLIAFLGIGRFIGGITPEMKFNFDHLTKHWLIDLLIASVVILIATGLLVSGWLHRGIYEPVSKLNDAMKKIREGDYTYVLETDEENEFGDLYRNYEDMRMQLKENAEEKSRQEEKNRELISNISHDLKTPITAIKGYAEGIMDGVCQTPEKTIKYVRTIYNKATDMDRLINELTTYSNVDNDRIPYKFLRINIADYFGDCVEEIGLDLEQRGIEFNYTNLVASDTLVIADPEQLKKVINNIISNSIKYIDKPKGVINLRLLDQNDSIMVEIEDNGRGIAQQDLQRVFDRFYRTDASRNSAQGGSGIGLSIVKKIIEDHGGYIWATSKEGESTCMHFVLRKYIEL
ncbi:MAG: HAMP domain-containing protein [Lachnospiraceae bacterium]|nr:HAMP domain-containing protein [Lachnospiraceae bacterium]